MLKQRKAFVGCDSDRPAAFRRLCVETGREIDQLLKYDPAAFRRLCVETTIFRLDQVLFLPAAFRRLCVETQNERQG